MPTMDTAQELSIDEKESHDQRVSEEVSSLSTKLIEAIDKQSSLETSNQILKRQNASLFQQLQELKDANELYSKSVAENAKLKADLEQSLKLKNNAEQEVSKLRVEIEDLSESLFDEANKMVKDARIEAEDYKIRNSKLSDTLVEKTITIESLTNELKILKKLLYDLENGGAQERKKSVVTTPNPSSDSLVSDSNEDSISVSQRDPTTLQSQLTMFASSKLNSFDNQLIYTPIYNSLRFDLVNFQEFVRFVKFLYSRNNNNIVTPVDFSILKETAFFKKIFKDEIEPALAIDVAPDVSYFNRKNFVSALVEGRVIIEPISGVNESFKLTHKKTERQETQSKENLFSYPKNSPPVATLSPCSICGESRNDILEHSRLYTLKLYSKKASNITQHKYDPPSSPATVSPALPNESPASSRATLEVTHQYSLCNYCLIRIRHVCEIFAFIRNINNSPKTKVWNFDSTSQSKESLDLECIKAWFQITKIRAKIFWSRIGIWDINEYSNSQPDISHQTQDTELGFRGSVIGTGIVAGNRQSFMDSINAGGGPMINHGRKPDFISSAKSSPVVSSPLNNQIKGYFEDEETAAISDDLIPSPAGSTEGPSIVMSAIARDEDTTEVIAKESAVYEKEEQADYGSESILDDYAGEENNIDVEDDQPPTDRAEDESNALAAASTLTDEVPVVDTKSVQSDVYDAGAGINSRPPTKDSVANDALATLDPKAETIESDEDDDSGDFNDASEHLGEQ